MILKLKNWGYAKAQFDNDKILKPSFNKLTCYNYFKKVFKATPPQRIFAIPSWLIKFNQPAHAFHDTPPTYVQITKIIQKMKWITMPSRSNTCDSI